MRIGIDARESGTSTGRYIDKLIEHLSKLHPSHEFVILTRSSRVEFIRQIAPNFEVVECDYREATFGEQYGLVWQLYGLRLDLIHFGMPQQPLLFFGQSTTTIHDLTTARFTNPSKNWLVFKFKQQVYKGLIRVVARKSRHLITVSDWTRSDLAHFAKVPFAKITTTHLAADLITTEPEAITKLKGQRFLLYVGRPLPHKNLERLVDTFGGLRSKYPKLQLVLAGKADANYQRLKNYVAKQNVQGVVFTDFVSEGQLRWLYEQATVYVFPSLSEGFGLPGLEAMNYGLPVVASQTTCLPEIYRDAALYFDPTDIEDMATKIGMVLDNKDLAGTLARKGSKLVKQYSWDKTAKATLAVYESLIEQSPAEENLTS